MQRIGMIGLGRMGGNMSRRLARAGIEVVAWDRSADARGAIAIEAARAGGRHARGAGRGAAGTTRGLDHAAGRRADRGDTRGARAAAGQRAT